MKNYINFKDIKVESINNVLDKALEYKSGKKSNILSNKTAILLFEKPSLRTKLSFWKGIKLHNGEPIYFGPDEIGLGRRESIKDVSNVINKMADLVIIRTFSHSSLYEYVKYSKIPVINALSDDEHPCQALADLLTIYEDKNTLNNLSVAYIGDANNVAKSLAFAISGVGGTFNIASPKEYSFDDIVIKNINEYGTGSIYHTEDPSEAVKNCDFIYTDVWTSMGQEKETQTRKEKFKSYQVTPNLLDSANPGVKLMHDMPAHEGEEISKGLLYDNRSIVFEQAENRIWAQTALMDIIFSINNEY
ncbi:MAG: ornithine carbamoyltransferase [Chloroflexi bacterium]|nr:ornithine carbamoyltransferase [Chloroflexota bacterium]|tara:strand:+ start:130 stop:1041 length:912 start_codon:yes stop_codon:yes gene_type:complete